MQIKVIFCRNVLVWQVLLHYQTVSEPATIGKLVSVLHKSSGEVLKKKPKSVSFFFVQFGRRPETESQSGSNVTLLFTPTVLFSPPQDV